ncbi:class I SAM-dependent methyltransferase [Deinococcus planocerae]|uniref:class I SAM-dependent methyltransferase n=1 Tax=Deinococcus planocerae TaxID=1737569 RepID=UPI000C7F3752|nr:class I SAM-dependent methyltransferase [Deinococcus planocerae]
MNPDLSRRAAHLRERMDDPNCDLPGLERTYAQFGTVNALVAGWRRVYRHELRPHLSPGRTLTLLDIGCGGGDVARHLARWARQGGRQLRVTAIDADERAVAYATGLPADPDVTFRQALSGDLVREGHAFDFVISNHLLHHLTDAELSTLLRDSEALGRVRVVHSDLARHPLAYRAFSAGARLFRGSFIREDGLLSIRRSHTARELAALAPPGWQVQPLVPFRLLLTRAGPHA